jgi:antirestriction protein ArdC
MPMTTAEVNQAVTDQMIAALKAGTVPWRVPWEHGYFAPPASLATGQGYRGINRFILALTAMDKGYTSPWWATYDTLAAKAGMVKKVNARGHGYWSSPDGTPRGVRKGEKSTLVIWYSPVLKQDADDPGEKIAFFKTGSARVFNACQAEALPAHLYAVPARSGVDAVVAADKMVARYLADDGPHLRHLPGGRAYYQMDADLITLPDKGQFTTSAKYYPVLFHELSHSTGHPSRLNRDGIASFDHFGSGQYAREELVAELSASMLAQYTGIEADVDNSAAYLASWLRRLESDPKLIISAASQAQKVLDYITGEADGGS